MAVIGDAPTTRAASVPAFDHVFVIVMENHSYGEIIGSPSAPYINSLASSGALADWYYGVSHPSLPNYLALVGGSTYGITSDCTTCWVSAANLPDVLDAGGSTWKAYEESMPSACYVGDSSPYAQKHDPFIYFNDIRSNSTRCRSHVVPYTQLSSDLQSTSTTPNYAFITPNMCNDMHDCTVATGDGWLQQNVPAILASPAFKNQRSLLALTWDEDDSSAGNNVPLIFLGAGVRSGYHSPATYDHFSLLHTIEAARGVSTITSTTGDVNAPLMSDMFGAASIAPCSAATLAAGASSPLAPGPVVPLTAGATCPGTPTYRFLVGAGGTWTVAQAYSTSSTFNWSTAGLATGGYQLEVDVRNQGSTAGYEAWSSMSFTLGLARCGVPTIAASPLGHGQTGVTVSLTGSTSACGSPTYRFLVGRSGRWSVVQGYTAGATYGWSSTGMAAGALQLEVDVRDQNSSSSYDGWAQIPYTLNACSTAHVTAGQTSPQPAGTTIALNATATCPGTPEYRFMVGHAGVWTVVRAYGTAATYSWPTAGASSGAYTLEVDVRNQGSTLGYETWSQTAFALS